MTTSRFLTAVAVLYAIFGAAFVVAPDALMTLNGAPLNSGGVLLGRVLGASLLGFALIYWSVKDHAREAVQPMLYAGLVYNSIDIVVGYHAITTGVMNSLAWGLVTLHVLLTLGFAYFAIAKAK